LPYAVRGVTLRGIGYQFFGGVFGTPDSVLGLLTTQRGRSSLSEADVQRMNANGIERTVRHLSGALKETHYTITESRHPRGTRLSRHWPREWAVLHIVVCILCAYAFLSGT
jgi:hypothetical protein